MGRRSRRFRCLDCDRLFWKKFEHLTKQNLQVLARETQCKHCNSKRWKITDETQFSGTLSKAGFHELKCKDCHEQYYVKVTGLKREKLQELAADITCKECSSEDIKFSDRVISYAESQNRIDSPYLPFS